MFTTDIFIVFWDNMILRYNSLKYNLCYSTCFTSRLFYSVSIYLAMVNNDQSEGAIFCISWYDANSH